MNPAVQALQQRWDAFLGKVHARLQEILAEAEPGINDIIATEVLDPAPLSGALSEVKARMLALRKKVDDSWEKIDEELDGAFDPQTSAQAEAFADLRTQMQRRGHALADEIETQGEWLEVRKSADAARALYPKAQAELQPPRRCTNCGGELPQAFVYRATNFTCTFCNALNTVQPGMATALYFAGLAPHALASEQAFPLWVEMERARDQYQFLRHPLPGDLQRYEAATTAYWRAYCQAYGAIHPDWTPEVVEQQIAGKVGQSMSSVAKYDGPRGQEMNAALAEAATGDPRRVMGLLQACHPQDGRSFVDDAIVAAHEHGDRRTTQVLLDVLYTLERCDEPKGEWMAEHLRELDRDLARR